MSSARRNLALLATLALGATACSADPTAQTVASDGAAASDAASTQPPSTTTVTAPPTTAAAVTTTIASTVTTSPSDPLLVTTDVGAVRGTAAEADGVRAFLGVPYAEAPVGDLRFAPPVARAAWADELDATAPGAACPQLVAGVTAQFLVTPDWDDDCLSLSVWTPDDAAELPVMVWIHGGSLVTGSAHQPFFIGDNLAARGVVVVNVNYRLGALGFLDGNWGLLDQVEALDWVQRNIAAFGGDPDAVTIFGESAGGFSVCGHLAASPSPPFTQAIIQSGSGCHRLQSPDDTRSATAEFLSGAGCDDRECARALTTDDLLEVPFEATLVVDGDTLTRSAFELAVAGDLTPRPIINGFNADEATLFTIGTAVTNEDELVALVDDFTDNPAALLAVYPADQFESSLARYQAMWTDVVFACPAIAFAGVTPETYVYEFTYVSPATPFDLGATHGAELAFVFGHPEGLTLLDEEPTDGDRAIADRVQEIWVMFAATGAPGWNRYDATAGGSMDIGLDNTFVDTIRNGRCDALNALIAP